MMEHTGQADSMTRRREAGTPRYLDLWTAKKIREAYPDSEAGCTCCRGGVTREAIDRYTERRLRETLEYAIANSPFYEERFGRAAMKLLSPAETAGDHAKAAAPEDFLKQFAKLPFMTPDDLRQREMDLLCVRPGEISRIVTLDTGGSTGRPKRVYFTEADQQLTVDFFGNGMQLLVDPGDRVLILMPAEMPGSIGRLLAQGLRDFGVGAVEYGLPQIGSAADEDQKHQEVERLLALMRTEHITSVVALPTHMRMLAEAVMNRRRNAEEVMGAGESGGAPGYAGDCPQMSWAYPLKSVLLSAEYVSCEDVLLIGRAFGCRVYEHYGMTEMGLGCAVSCGQGAGYHIREPDLYIEIIDPGTGRVIEDDGPGEVVFTTLTRKGMPFIRYRTGDYSSWIATPCQCGSVMKRISKVGPREQVKGYLRRMDSRQ